MAARKVQAADRLSRKVTIRLRNADWLAYLEKIQSSDLTPSEFFRRCVLTNETQIVVRQRPDGDYRQMLYAVNKIGNNLNQLAHAANSAHLSGRVSEFTYLAMLDHLRWIEQFLKGLLDRAD